MARFGALLFGGASLVTMAGLVLPHQPEVDEAGLAAVAGAAGLMAALLRARAERLPGWVFHAVVAAGTVLISLALLFNGERHGGPAGGDEMYYLWVVLYAAYFLGPLATTLQAGLIALAYAITLIAIDPGAIGVSRWLSTIGLVIGSAIVVSMLSARIARLVADLERAARTDRLTGLPNRLAFEEHFAQEVGRAIRTERPFAFLLADLDHLKQINDRLGHVAGDAALTELGRRLPSELRAVDVAARVGGDEFAIILPDTNEEGAREIGERIRHAVRDHTYVGATRVGISFGVAIYDRDGHTLDDLTRVADQALYRAKRRGAGATADDSPWHELEQPPAAAQAGHRT